MKSEEGEKILRPVRLLQLLVLSSSTLYATLHPIETGADSFLLCLLLDSTSIYLQRRIPLFYVINSSRALDFRSSIPFSAFDARSAFRSL